MLKPWLAASVVLTAIPILAQPEAAPKLMTEPNPGVEVAVIKPSRPDAQNRGYSLASGRIQSMNTTVANLITFAYDLHERQIVNGPAWMGSDKYDVTAKPDADGQPNLDQAKALFRNLLAERFHLKFRRDKKELSVYAIVVPAKSKHKLISSAPEGEGPYMMFPRAGYLPAKKATMTEFAQVMQRAVLDRPVVDQTGLQGRFDFTLNWTPDEFQFLGLSNLPAQNRDQPAPNLFEAFEQQLGLKLEATRTLAEVLVIDSVDRPSEN
jgi:uncharacterized protein (TIGR03435 family)